MKSILVLILASTVAGAQTLAGHWQGTLQGKTPHRLALDVVESIENRWKATLYSIDEFADDVPLISLAIHGSTIAFQLSENQGSYEGVLTPDGASIKGVFTDTTHPSRALTFQRATKATAWKFLVVSDDDVQTIRRARELLGSPEKWNRADNRRCPAQATTFSLYCALEKAAVASGGHFEHRAAVMQEARFVIDYDLASGNHYHHRLMDYNNDPKTTFIDTRRFFDLLEKRVSARLRELQSPPYN